MIKMRCNLSFWSCDAIWFQCQHHVIQMYVCMLRESIHLGMYVAMSVYMHACIHARMYLCIYMYVYRHICMYVHTCIYYKHACMHRCVYIGHVMPLMLHDVNSIVNAPLHSFNQDNQNDIRHDIPGLLTQLALEIVSHDTDSITDDTITFLKMIKMRCNMTFWSFDAFGTSFVIMWC